MKNRRLLLILITLVFAISLTFTVVTAYAEDASPRNANVYYGDGYTLSSVVDNAKRVVGVDFSGYYFGGSGIEVSVRIYGDDAVAIDFPINQSASNLTPTQKSTQAKILALAERINDYIQAVDACANTQYDGLNGLPLSDVYRYNNASYGDRLEISEAVYNMINVARQMYNATNGAFNPAVYRLVDLWGFSSRIYSNGNFGLPYDRPVTGEEFFNNGYPLPSEKYVQAFSAPAFTDFSDDAVTLSQENGKFYITKNVRPAVVDGVSFEQWLDLGGIAKGYAVDGVREMLKDSGFARYYVDAGTSSQAYARNYDGGDYVLLVQDPYNRDLIEQPAVVGARLQNATVSTSGTYERKYVTDGVSYAHIIDGSLGKPAQTGVDSITIIAPQSYSATMGDCLTTALTVMGRDRVVAFMNGYLKDNGIEVILIYQTVDGGKQLLSNIPQERLTQGDTFNQYAWSIKTDDNGKFAYDATAKAPVSEFSYAGWLIALGVAVVFAVITVIVFHFVKGRKNVERNVLNAKRDKPFKIGDVGIYLAVVLVIVVLFAVFFGVESEELRAVSVVDFSNSTNGELLFAYSFVRNEWVIFSDNSNGWNVEVSEKGAEIEVKFTKSVNGKEFFNVMTITRGAKPSVKMSDATCPDKDCVRNFPAIERAGRAIVCSPNRLKVLSQ